MSSLAGSIRRHPWRAFAGLLLLTVWCDLEHVDAWRRFITERDVPHDPPAATK